MCANHSTIVPKRGRCRGRTYLGFYPSLSLASPPITNLAIFHSCDSGIRTLAKRITISRASRYTTVTMLSGPEGNRTLVSASTVQHRSLWTTGPCKNKHYIADVIFNTFVILTFRSLNACVCFGGRGRIRTHNPSKRDRFSRPERSAITLYSTIM